MYTVKAGMWAPSEPTPSVVMEFLALNPPVSPYKKVITPAYNHNYIGIGDFYKPPGLSVNFLKFHPVPQTPDKVKEQHIVRKY